MNAFDRTGTAEAATSRSGIFIDNEWRPAESGKTLDLVEPATGRPFDRIAAGNARDVDAAVAAARRAFDGAWGRIAAVDRGRLLSRLAARIREAAGDLAVLEARDTGKPLSQARADLDLSARYFEFYGGATDKVHGRSIPYQPGTLALTERVAHGVTGHIIPWNYPAQMVGRTLAPALAMGNATVLKPAEDACLTALRLAELARDAGFPAGAINVVPGRGEVAGAALSRHAGVDFLSFTGSPEVGTQVQVAAARRHAGCVLELGGKSPQVVLADADLDAAVPVIVASVVQNAGQTCSAGSRVLVDAAIAGTLTERLAAAFAALVAGPPEADLDLGPLINLKQKRRVARFCDLASAADVPLVAEGRLDPRADPDGFYVLPRLYGPVPRDHPMALQEIFGPVLSLLTFTDEDDAVRLANGTEYGLVAGVWSRDGARALRIGRRIAAGQVFINGYGSGGGVELPFGGVGKSGHGREKGYEALFEFSASRTIVIAHG
ncbi:aldehyde dehydrogenase family protein [Roseivivax isoporae]|uniref:Aldehyde dehydrogenase n=1 Tax=Roseivivax isoporae LMG 25204 TaxID=1449351 RepID=X7FFL2_9RHOB|nr:aldehyde dehydrogenase family protein [Roseivivax isoporae]ETX30819.1 aldehyde dehydrogenase [Roseivivax isoporae LMG 25204]